MYKFQSEFKNNLEIGKWVNAKEEIFSRLEVLKSVQLTLYKELSLRYGMKSKFEFNSRTGACQENKNRISPIRQEAQLPTNQQDSGSIPTSAVGLISSGEYTYAMVYTRGGQPAAREPHEALRRIICGSR